MKHPAVLMDFDGTHQELPLDQDVSIKGCTFILFTKHMMHKVIKFLALNNFCNLQKSKVTVKI